MKRPGDFLRLSLNMCSRFLCTFSQETCLLSCRSSPLDHDAVLIPSDRPRTWRREKRDQSSVREMMHRSSVFRLKRRVGQCERSLSSLNRHRMGVVSRCHDRVADASLALFQSWDCPVKTEGETLEHIGSYAGTLPFTGNGHLRPYSYGLLDQQVLQPIMPMITPKDPRFPGNVDGQPYVNHFLSFTVGDWLVGQTPLRRAWPPIALSFRFLRLQGRSLPGRPTPFALLVLWETPPVHSPLAQILTVWPLPLDHWHHTEAVDRTVLRAFYPASWLVTPITRRACFVALP